MARSRTIVRIAGPTASGKSALALDLAEAMGGTVINADSMQVYRDLRIVTARPTPEEEARVPHRLYGVLAATDVCSVARWLSLAVEEVSAAWQRGDLPVVVGGTGLYLKGLEEGLSPIPEVPGEVRRDSRALYDRLGGTAFRRLLARLDPEAAAGLPDGDRQRLIRAHEVATATGRALSDWRRQAPPVPVLTDVRFLTVLFAPPRDALYARCDARFDRMLAAGALDEIAVLDSLGLDPDLPLMKAVGVPELLALHRGKATLDSAREAAQKATRRYAKRQTTWFRHQLRADREVDALYSPAVAERVLAELRGIKGL